MRTVGGVVALSLLVVTLIAAAANRASSESVSLTASSTARGTSVSALIDAAEKIPAPAVAPYAGVGAAANDLRNPTAADFARPATVWRSVGAAVGSWVEFTWPKSARVNHLRVDAAGGAAGSYSQAQLSFDGGSQILVVPDRHGNVSLSFPQRSVHSARLSFIAAPKESTHVALQAVAIDDKGPSAAPATVIPVPTLTSSGSLPGTSPAAAVDGSIAAGQLGAVWRAPSGSTSSWLAETWATPVLVSALQVAGPSVAVPAQSATVTFSDGTSVPVVVGSGSQPVSTVAFAARSVRWARLQISGTNAAIGEFRLIPSGTTPPTWPTTSGITTTSPAETAACSANATAIGTAPSASQLALVCPATGTAVSGSARVVIAGPVGATVTASAWVSGPNAVRQISSAVIPASGRSVFDIPTASLMAGPVGIKFVASTSSTPLYVQLVNRTGVAVAGKSYAPGGMTLQFSDDFTSPLSVSASGSSAKYAALKPDGGGGAQFGDAVFSDPAGGSGLLSTNNGNLVISSQNTTTDPNGWGRKYAAGLISSTRVGGSGFAAQYGYFEARILAPAGTGTWPAFWMLNSQSAVAGQNSHSGEVDGVELYGNYPMGSCHSMHNWPATDGPITGTASCFSGNGASDWALTWHTYGVRIRPGGADYYIDDKLVASHNGLVLDSAPYFFMVNLALGGGWPVNLSPTGGVVSMYVDWVHVYN
ncbi:hypothetical protein AZH51_13820 [Branchiibius sp. NY16-3462-2]|nr:hypothetical protein AZH51_13820 [Branchiibius sp. NY16-3462-2]